MADERIEMVICVLSVGGEMPLMRPDSRVVYATELCRRGQRLDVIETVKRQPERAETFKEMLERIY